MFDVNLTILYAPNCRTLKESRKVCCRVLGFHRLIRSQYSTHTPQCSTLTPRFFRGPFFRGPFFRGPFFRGPFSRGPFFRGPFFRELFSKGPFFRDFFSKGPFFRDLFFKGPFSGDFFPGGLFFRDSVEIVDLALRAIINSFEIYTTNSLIKKKIRDSFHYVQTFTWGNTTKTK